MFNLNLFVILTFVPTIGKTTWGDLSNLVKEEQEKGNPLARIITRLKLEVGILL